MRWKQHQKGDTRIRSGFLFFPKFIGGEWRWLERATWKEYYYLSAFNCFWVSQEWIDTPTSA